MAMTLPKGAFICIQLDEMMMFDHPELFQCEPKGSSPQLLGQMGMCEVTGQTAPSLTRHEDQTACSQPGLGSVGPWCSQVLDVNNHYVVLSYPTIRVRLPLYR